MNGNIGALVFETFINMYQACVAVWFVVHILSVSHQYSIKKVYQAGVIPIFILLEVQLLVTDYEGIGIIALFILLFAVTICFMTGSIFEKLISSFMFIIISTIAALMAGSIVGIVVDLSYIELVKSGSYVRYFTIILNQVVLLILCVLFARLAKKNSVGINMRSTIIGFIMLVISALSMLALQSFIYDPEGVYALVYACIVLVGIILITVTGLVLYMVEEKQYKEMLIKETETEKYRQQLKDIDSIRTFCESSAKRQHEVNKIFGTLEQLLDDGNIRKAKELIIQFDRNKLVNAPKIIYTKNVILNYLLNRKLDEARHKGIDVRCIVNGIIDGVEDIDIHTIICNLLDNVLEAVENLEKKYMAVSIYGSEHIIYIEVCNTADTEKMYQNPDLKTTKNDSIGHGYGIKNIRDTVGKYNGTVEFQCEPLGYFICKITLVKNSGQKQAVHDKTIE